MEEVYLIDDHIWQDCISVVFTDDINKAIKEQCKIHSIKPDRYLVKHAAAVVNNIEEKNYYATWILFDFDKVNEGIILHECGHATFNLLTRRDIKHNKHTEEVFQYTHQWLFNKICSFWNEVKNLQKCEPSKG